MAGVRAKSVPRRDAEGRGASPLPCQGSGGGQADWGGGVQRMLRAGGPLHALRARRGGGRVSRPTERSPQGVPRCQLRPLGDGDASLPVAGTDPAPGVPTVGEAGPARGQGEEMGLAPFPTAFCWEPKTALKAKSVFKKHA